MLLWIKAVLLTMWHGIRYIAIYALAAIVGWFLSSVMPYEMDLLLLIAFIAMVALVFAALLIYAFVTDVRDNYEHLLHKAWLEKSARGGEKQ